LGLYQPNFTCHFFARDLVTHPVCAVAAPSAAARANCFDNDIFGASDIIATFGAAGAGFFTATVFLGGLPRLFTTFGATSAGSL
jgi:hypothetical protein